jgi:putative hydrolase of the HAD superfamily
LLDVARASLAHLGSLLKKTWLFDLDDTLHDASHAALGQTSAAMTAYMVSHLAMTDQQATELRQHYWNRYGATLLGLIKHHGVKASHFLEETHRLPGLEQRVRMHAADRAALARLPGRKFILTNAPRSYALRVLDTLRLTGLFDGILSIEDMTMFGHHRPKPDARMFRAMAARLKTRPSRCVLVEDTLAHQRSARKVGMRTAWMQRYLRAAIHAPGSCVKVSVHPCPKPAYVCARIKQIQALRSIWCIRDDNSY